MGAADHGTGIIHEAGAVCQQRTGTERVGLAGFVLNALPLGRRQFSQSRCQRHGFHRKERKMNPATVAGTAPGTDNLIPVPAEDALAAPVNFFNQILIFLEGLRHDSFQLCIQNRMLKYQEPSFTLSIFL
jgi:hypothetical protein